VFSLFTVTLPNGASDLILGVIMAAMLLFRPQGLTGGSEFSLGFLKGRSVFGFRPAALAVGKPEPEADPSPPDAIAPGGDTTAPHHVEPVEPH
jgi:hypothetical protein